MPDRLPIEKTQNVPGLSGFVQTHDFSKFLKTTKNRNFQKSPINPGPVFRKKIGKNAKHGQFLPKMTPYKKSNPLRPAWFFKILKKSLAWAFEPSCLKTAYVVLRLISINLLPPRAKPGSQGPSPILCIVSLFKDV